MIIILSFVLIVPAQQVFLITLFLIFIGIALSALQIIRCHSYQM